MKTKHVVMFSTGAGSAYLAKYVIDKYGKENTILLMTDTLWEDEDNYRFMQDVTDYLNMPMTFQNDGRNPEEIFKEQLYFGNFGTAPCSKILKMKQTFEYVQNLIENGILPILYFGIGYEEAQRAPRIAFNYKHNVDVFEDGVEVRFPLIGEINGTAVNGDDLLEGLDAEKIPPFKVSDIYARLEVQNAVICNVNAKREITEGWGLKLPRMYALGFSHANCAGRCIKGGFGHYRTLYKVWRDVYLAQEQMEREVMEERVRQGKNPYSILGKEQIQPNGTKKKATYSLEQFRKEVLEMEDQSDIFDFLDEEKPCECVF
jgi:hypothetical protein